MCRATVSLLAALIASCATRCGAGVVVADSRGEDDDDHDLLQEPNRTQGFADEAQALAAAGQQVMAAGANAQALAAAAGQQVMAAGANALASTSSQDGPDTSKALAWALAMGTKAIAAATEASATKGVATKSGSDTKLAIAALFAFVAGAQISARLLLVLGVLVLTIGALALTSGVVALAVAVSALAFGLLALAAVAQVLFAGVQFLAIGAQLLAVGSQALALGLIVPAQAIAAILGLLLR